MPPFAGFFSKEAVLGAAEETALHEGPVGSWAGWLVLVVGLLTVAVTAAYVDPAVADDVLRPAARPALPRTSRRRRCAGRWSLLAVPSVLVGLLAMMRDRFATGRRSAAGWRRSSPGQFTDFERPTWHRTWSPRSSPCCWSRSAPAPCGGSGDAHRRPTRRARLRGHRALVHAFYVDNLYDRAFVRPVRVAAPRSARDRRHRGLAAVLGSGRGAKLLAGVVARTQRATCTSYLTGLLAGVAAHRRRGGGPDMNTVSDWVLPLLLAVPLAGSVALLLLPPRLADRIAVWLGVVVTAATLGVSIWAAATTPETDETWVPDLGLRFHLGIDGISSPLVLLTALLTFLCMVYLLRVRPEAGRLRALVGLLLLLEVGMLGTFVALDLLLFFVFFEVVLVPMWFVIALWGDDKVPGGRLRAANIFILFTLLGSAVMLLGILLVGLTAGTFDIVGAHGPSRRRADATAPRSSRSWRSHSASRSRRRCGRCTPGCRTRTPPPRPSGRCCSPACC